MANEHEGHRDRLRSKVETGVLLEHERLEVFLFPLLPRRNTNDIAHRLLSRFGSVYGVFSASVAELTQVKGIGERVAAQLYNMGVVYRQDILPRKSEKRFQGVFHSKDFLPYVKEKYASIEYEVLDLYLLDSKGEICNTYRFTDEDGGSVAIESTELADILVQEKPSGVVFVHNHPQGEGKYSQADSESTKQCQLVCNLHGVLLCDHILCGKDGVYSYYLDGTLQAISRKFSVHTLTKEEGENHLAK